MSNMGSWAVQKKVASNISQGMKDFDEEHKVVEKTQRGLSSLGTSIRNFDQEHRVMEKSTTALANSCRALAKLVRPKSDQE